MLLPYTCWLTTSGPTSTPVAIGPLVPCFDWWALIRECPEAQHFILKTGHIEGGVGGNVSCNQLVADQEKGVRHRSLG